jgi:4'-phosphopantetheinyl transferase
VGDHAKDVDRFSRDCLSDDERGHLGRYRSRDAAERYVVTRSLVRGVLGERLGVPARDLRVSRTDTGKPIVAEGVHFNVSHSGDLILVALSSRRAIGVDIERRREVERVDAMTRRWLDVAERREMGRLETSGVSRSDAFLRVWSLKEARLKALGVGISGASGAQLHTVYAEPLDPLLATLEHKRGESYVGAVAFA